MTVNGGALVRVGEQKDLGIQVQFLSVMSQADKVLNKAFRTLVFISHGIEYRSRNIIL